MRRHREVISPRRCRHQGLLVTLHHSLHQQHRKVLSPQRTTAIMLAAAFLRLRAWRGCRPCQKPPPKSVIPQKSMGFLLFPRVPRYIQLCHSPVPHRYPFFPRQRPLQWKMLAHVKPAWASCRNPRSSAPLLGSAQPRLLPLSSQSSSSAVTAAEFVGWRNFPNSNEKTVKMLDRVHRLSNITT